ncbi:hypothetical protein GE061_018048 [Apolygus lucorum]|uniref:Gustatory receptor n=1 Tax=Apolygus lucorum TaxID=248454 RepID=A0A6A4JF19_APOLU|nr:hypothetical protein GE061_018048 [Apolygus lucorum]
MAFAELKVPLHQQLYTYVWVSVLAAILICTLRGCHSATSQANSCNELLLKHLVHTNKPEYKEQSLLVLHLCARKNLVFKAFKSFTINYTLGISMMAAYLTYVIVMFQVDHASKTSHSSMNPETTTLLSTEN